ncbi:Signal peptidase I [Lunatimonas lonarensis]|uniref:Signal peptidase I n=1 Tax=Lunatimonas lonarensis TaxID=1232681 RepID=R7ZVY3_9BACT|nr:signal peptidase I [Lunatimonas lonarensis]EON78310.1 Signal peptidase I [Lunatimonas lonarensis]
MSTTPKNKSAFREWADALLFAVIAASLIRWLLLEPFTIPTASMEKSLLVGDFLFVSKMHYGTRIPRTILQVPLTHQKIWGTNIPSYSDAVQLPYFRLPGFTSVKRNDVVVFNYPEEHEFPADLKTNYIKRAVGIAGDVLEIRDTQVYINGQPSENPTEMQFSYDVMTNRPLNAEFFDQFGINPDSFYPFSDNSGYLVFATAAMAEQLASSPVVSSVKKRTSKEGQGDGNIFPDGAFFGWNKDHYGPLEIPAKGWTIPMTEDNVRKYAYTIEKFEGHANLSVDGNQIYIDGKKIDSYTFKQDYYFMMGDNRHDSLDSRFWGFVPEDHVVGKAWFLWLSLEKHKTFLNKIRWNRFFKSIH